MQPQEIDLEELNQFENECAKFYNKLEDIIAGHPRIVVMAVLTALINDSISQMPPVGQRKAVELLSSQIARMPEKGGRPQ
jgi:hypothetical protein